MKSLNAIISEKLKNLSSEIISLSHETSHVNKLSHKGMIIYGEFHLTRKKSNNNR